MPTTSVPSPSSLVGSIVPSPSPSGAGTTIVNNLPAASSLLPWATIIAGVLTLIGVVTAAAIARKNANNDRAAAKEIADNDRAAAQTTLDTTLGAAAAARVADREEARRLREEDLEAARARRAEDLELERQRRADEAVAISAQRKQDLEMARSRRFEERIADLLAGLLDRMDLINEAVKRTYVGEPFDDHLFVETVRITSKLRLYARQRATLNALRDFGVTALRISSALREISEIEPTGAGVAEAEKEIRVMLDGVDLFRAWSKVQASFRTELGIPDVDPTAIEVDDRAVT